MQKASLSLTLSQVSRHSGFRTMNKRIQQKQPPPPSKLSRQLLCLWSMRRREPTSTHSWHRSLLARWSTRIRILGYPPRQPTGCYQIWSIYKPLILPLVHQRKHLCFRWDCYPNRLRTTLGTRTPRPQRSTHSYPPRTRWTSAPQTRTRTTHPCHGSTLAGLSLLTIFDWQFHFLCPGSCALVSHDPALFYLYSDCVVVPAALYSWYVVSFVMGMEPLVLLYGCPCTYSSFTVSHGVA